MLCGVNQTTANAARGLYGYVRAGLDVATPHHGTAALNRCRTRW